VLVPLINGDDFPSDEFLFGRSNHEWLDLDLYSCLEKNAFFLYRIEDRGQRRVPASPLDLLEHWQVVVHTLSEHVGMINKSISGDDEAICVGIAGTHEAICVGISGTEEVCVMKISDHLHYFNFKIDQQPALKRAD